LSDRSDCWCMRIRQGERAFDTSIPLLRERTLFVRRAVHRQDVYDSGRWPNKLHGFLKPKIRQRHLRVYFNSPDGGSLTSRSRYFVTPCSTFQALCSRLYVWIWRPSMGAWFAPMLAPQQSAGSLPPLPGSMIQPALRWCAAGQASDIPPGRGRLKFFFLKDSSGNGSWQLAPAKPLARSRDTDRDFFMSRRAVLPTESDKVICSVARFVASQA